VFAICQRVTVMRDGRHVLSGELAGMTTDDLVRAMVGRQMEARAPGERRAPGGPVLEVDRLTREGVFAGISFQVRAGEIVALAGERSFAADWAVRRNLKFGRRADPVLRLSGGNQQKVVLAKWLGRGPALLVVDEPTRGIDIATKAEVHRLLVRLAGDGVAI